MRGEPASVPERIARLCAEVTAGLGEIPQIAPLLPPLLTAVRRGDDVGHVLDELNTALLRAGVEGGLDGGAQRSFAPLAGVRGHPLEEAWMCPAERCVRAELVLDHPEQPECAVYRRALRRVRLPS
ncbi:hypothetical protein ACIQVN_02475 [Streptomyces cyaneofuscatus]|uniref:hypothetical protein n=1 Tax=Streptomyces cyaneofuscatus TaxID=66883 RepID=UPI00382F8807